MWPSLQTDLATNEMNFQIFAYERNDFFCITLTRLCPIDTGGPRPPARRPSNDGLAQALESVRHPDGTMPSAGAGDGPTRPPRPVAIVRPATHNAQRGQ